MAEQATNTHGPSANPEVDPQHATSGEVPTDESRDPGDLQMEMRERSSSPSSASSDSLSELGFDTIEWPVPNTRCVNFLSLAITNGLMQNCIII